jgi:uracil-DNA glycosylase family 4
VTHPVERLRSIVAADFTANLPKRVHPLSAWCPEPQFFPGGSGMPTETAWDDVIPGVRGHPETFPAPEGRDVMVLGNFQATLDTYQRVAAGSDNEFSTTWRVLRRLLTAVPPRRVFLTNVHIGLPDQTRTTAPFPTSPAFLERCRRLLATEIDLLEPSTVVCLGRPAAEMLASVATGADSWTPWPGFERIIPARQVLTSCELNDVQFTAVAVRHPSAVLSNQARQQETDAIAAAANATDKDEQAVGIARTQP